MVSKASYNIVPPPVRASRAPSEASPQRGGGPCQKALEFGLPVPIVKSKKGQREEVVRLGSKGMVRRKNEEPLAGTGSDLILAWGPGHSARS